MSSYNYMKSVSTAGMNLALLAQGAKMLRDDAANPKGVKFDLGTWGERGDVEAETASMQARWTQNTQPEKVEASCNTKACAMGLFAISGAFEKLSYQFTTSYNNGDGDLSVVLLPVLDIGMGEANPTAFRAAQELFGIDYETALYLFDPGKYNATKGAEAELDVAERIEQLIAGYVDPSCHDTYEDADGSEDEDDWEDED